MSARAARLLQLLDELRRRRKPVPGARLAELLGVSIDAISVKATTTERLGFPGRGEGIAAQAAAVVLVPA